MRGTIILFALWLGICSAMAQIPPGYYSAADGKKGDALRAALSSCISEHEQLNYDGLDDLMYGEYKITDFRPDGTLWDIYSTCEYYMEDAGGTQDDFCQHWNKEHTVCQSWFGGSYPMYSDIFHLLPTDARVNNLRSNFAYGETSERNDKISQGAPYALGHLGPSTVMSNVTVYQPDNRYMGDIARIYFYMATCYMDKKFTQAEGGRIMFTYTDGKADLSGYSVNLLMKWHRNDPVSYKEIARNDSVYKVQKNRNPFVDYPDLAEYIWGDKKDQNINLATLLSAYSKDYVPLDTEGSDRTDYDKFGVTWFANGQELKTDSVFKSHKPTELPAAPASCSQTSSKFMGWSATTIAGVSQSAPADLFTQATDAPTIGKDETFYAVYAHEEQGVGQGDVTETASFTTNDGYKRGKQVTSAKAGKVTITFDKADASTAATFYTEVRCYAGSKIILTGATITKVEFVPGPNDNGNPITANTGAMNGLIWTGKANSVTFTIGGDSKSRGLSAIKVTYDDNTTVFVYSDYLTSCDGTTAISNQKSEISAQKILRDGQLIIIHQGREYNILGL